MVIAGKAARRCGLRQYLCGTNNDNWVAAEIWRTSASKRLVARTTVSMPKWVFVTWERISGNLINSNINRAILEAQFKQMPFRHYVYCVWAVWRLSSLFTPYVVLLRYKQTTQFMAIGLELCVTVGMGGKGHKVGATKPRNNKPANKYHTHTHTCASFNTNQLIVHI